MQEISDNNNNKLNYNIKKNDKQYKFSFTKMNGAGNDFVVLHKVERINGDSKPVTYQEFSKVATKISDRKFGIGCDQIIMVDDNPQSSEANYAMHVINNDGEIELMCGNGVRCASKYILDNNIISKKKQYIPTKENQGEQLIETLSGIIKTYPLLGHQDTSLYDNLLMIKVNMGKIKLASTTIKSYNNQVIEKGVELPRESFIFTIDIGLPYCDKIEFALIGCGGTQAVVFIERNIELGYIKATDYNVPLNKMNIKEIAERIQESSLFFKDNIPNVEFVVQSNQDKLENILQARVVERGTGETLACGTGACGVATAAYLLNYVNDKSDIKVQMPGGNLLIQWSSINSELFKTGPAQSNFTSEFIV